MTTAFAQDSNDAPLLGCEGKTSVGFAGCFEALRSWGLDAAAAQLEPAAFDALQRWRNGHWSRWESAWAELPSQAASQCDFSAPTVVFGHPEELAAEQRAALPDALLRLHPWRKGPFSVFGTHIDTEWRSDFKWARVQPHAVWQDARVLDIGCGNGYYGWRMLASGARGVIGLDPFLAYHLQHAALRRLAPDAANWLLPVGSEAMPPDTQAFDVVCSFGVLYHRRDPVAHLAEVRGHLRPGGSALVETLVVAGNEKTSLQTSGRYAKMRNVWQIPTVPMLLDWAHEAGFTSATCVDVTPTTTAEQRRTPWMRFESLNDFLDPSDTTRTVEGLPAPMRAVIRLGQC